MSVTATLFLASGVLVTARDQNPPPGCGALWKMAQLGKCVRATPRQAGGGFVPGSAGLGLEPDCTEKRSLRLPRRAECAFPSRRRPGGAGPKPPARLRGTMENGSTGQMRSGNPPPAWRGVCARVRRPRPRARLHGKAQSGQRASLMARPELGRDTIRLPVVG